MRILVTGGAGQLGTDVNEVLLEKHELLSVDLEELDITDAQAVERLVDTWRPEVVVNCAAFTQVDACESHEDQAFRVNGEGPRHLAAAAAKVGAWLLHVSTDYVFDGQKAPPQPYLESDATGPLSCYGKSKLAGEIAIQETSKRFTIVRTAWVYGRHGKNFLKTILRVALTDPQRQLKVVHDQFGSLTWSYRLAHQLKKLLDEGGQGIYHATAEGFCTWYEVATHFFNRMRVTNRVIPCTTSDYPTPARRPHNSILENRRLKEYGINVMRHWQEDLDEFVARHREALWQEAVNPNLI